MTQWCVEGKNGNLPCIPNFKDAENYSDKRYNSAPNCILCADFVRKSLIIGLNWSNIQYQPDHSQVTIIYLVTWPNKYLTAFYNADCVKAALQFTLNTGQTKTGRLILGCNKVKLCRGLIWFPWSCPDGRLGDKVFGGDRSQRYKYFNKITKKYINTWNYKENSKKLI